MNVAPLRASPTFARFSVVDTSAQPPTAVTSPVAMSSMERTRPNRFRRTARRSAQTARGACRSIVDEGDRLVPQGADSVSSWLPNLQAF